VTLEQGYIAEVKSGVLQHDEEQLRAIQRLQVLYDDLTSQSQHHSANVLKQFFQRKVKPVTGLYLWGGTGRGKTFLMDYFYNVVPFTEKYRVHFHRFMLDIHEQLKQLPKSPDPLTVIAKELATRYRLICLDEFHVHDIADAMLMVGLLKALFENKVTLVTTSNIAIDDLYKNGLQRDRFMYAIDLLHEHTDEVEIGNSRDYRLINLEKNDCYQVVEPGQGQQVLLPRFEKLAIVSAKHDRVLTINNRPIHYIALADDLIWFDFRELCATPRSANDYIEIAKIHSTVFISDIHIMNEAHDDVAKRFIHLIDALYDHHVKLVVTAEAMPGQLYEGERLNFAFQRTISRLTEMGGHHYLSLAHI
jgi:cell division protein ZapE